MIFNPLRYYKYKKMYRTIKNSELFDPKYYLFTYTDVRKADIDPIKHYIKHGAKEGRNPNKYFDTKFYLNKYKDVKDSGVNPLFHYIKYGVNEGRNPNKSFDTKYYLEKYQDVKENGMNPLLHYIKHGESKGRKINSNNITYADHSKNTNNKNYCKRIFEINSNTWDYKREENFKDYLKNELKLNNLNLSNIMISIIMPTYNRESTIKAAVLSVLEQEHTNFELIIIDDGSSDNTQSVIESFSDNRIKYLKQNKCGVSTARNRGLKAVQGDYIFFLDSDNRWKKDFVRNMLIFSLMENLDVAYSAIALTDDFKNYKSYIGMDFDYLSLQKQNYIDLNCICYKNNGEILYFDETIKRLVDWDFILHLSYMNRIKFAPFLGVEYYDGNEYGRITKTENKSKKELQEIIHYIQRKNLELIKNTYKEEASIEQSIAVVFHIFHLEYVDELMERLCYLPDGFDLFITTPLVETEILFSKIRTQFPTVTLLKYSNVGRDIGAFINLIPTILKYDLVLKIHTKRDIPELGSVWRNILLETILANKNTVKNICDSFKNDHTLMAVGSQDVYINDNKYSKKNKLNIEHIYKSLNLNTPNEENWGFFAGSMFWFCPKYLKPLESLGKSINYQIELSNDNNIEHALERILGMLLSKDEHNQIILLSIDKDMSIKFKKQSVLKGGSTNKVTAILRETIINKELNNLLTKKTKVKKLRKKLLTTGLAQLSLAIKIPVPNLDVAQEWGDYHFACSLAESFKTIGFNIRIDFLKEWYDDDKINDDITIVLRGLSQYKPLDNKINVLWNISHPDKISYEEYEAYDMVYVSSLSYANLLNNIVSTHVKPLLQATDQTRFFPIQNTQVACKLLFVGNSRKEYRQIIKWSIDEKFEPTIYGTLWENFIDKKLIHGNNISNKKLNQYYSNASITLNDHWESMKDFGFISNRIFDVLGSGGRIVSDHIHTLKYLFSDIEQLKTITSPLTLTKAINNMLSANVIKNDEVVEYIHKYHTFDQRAKVITNDIYSILNLPRLYPEENSDSISKQNKSKINIALIPQIPSQHPSSSFYIRLLSPLTMDNIYENIKIEIYDIDKYDKFPVADVYIIQRLAFTNIDQAKIFVDTVVMNNAKIIVDSDDAFSMMDKEHNEYDRYSTHLEAFEYLIHHASKVWLSTDKLAEIYNKYKEKITVIPNTVDKRIWKQYSVFKDINYHLKLEDINILYMGTATHNQDFLKIFDDIKNFRNKAKNKNVTLTLIGAVSLDLSNYTWIKKLDIPKGYSSYPKFSKWLQKHNEFTIGIAPLEDNIFNACKSDMKFLDYTSMGILSMLPNYEPYNHLKAGKQKAIFVKDGEWTKALLDFSEDKYDKTAILKNANEYLWDKRTNENIIAQQLKDITTIVQNKVAK